MRLIDADNMIEDGYTTFPHNLDYCDDGDLCEWLYDQPTIDAVKVIRCAQCDFYSPAYGVCTMKRAEYEKVDFDGFCSDAEPKRGTE